MGRLDGALALMGEPGPARRSGAKPDGAASGRPRAEGPFRTTRLRGLGVLLVGLVTGPALADDGRRLALAKRLVAQIQTDETLRSVLPLMTAQMRSTLAQQGRGGEDADAYVALFEKRLGAEIGRYGDQMAEAYAQAFTEDDLSGMIAFDDTPLGRKIIAERPALEQASALSLQSLERQVAQEVADELARRKAQDAPPRKL